jgi:hypothetical protein
MVGMLARKESDEGAVKRKSVVGNGRKRGGNLMRF